jgi:hypothetical protein
MMRDRLARRSRRRMFPPGSPHFGFDLARIGSNGLEPVRGEEPGPGRMGTARKRGPNERGRHLGFELARIGSKGLEMVRDAGASGNMARRRQAEVLEPSGRFGVAFIFIVVSVLRQRQQITLCSLCIGRKDVSVAGQGSPPLAPRPSTHLKRRIEIPRHLILSSPSRHKTGSDR